MATSPFCDAGRAVHGNLHRLHHGIIATYLKTAVRVRRVWIQPSRTKGATPRNAIDWMVYDGLIWFDTGKSHLKNAWFMPRLIVVLHRKTWWVNWPVGSLTGAHRAGLGLFSSLFFCGCKTDVPWRNFGQFVEDGVSISVWCCRGIVGMTQDYVSNKGALCKLR